MRITDSGESQENAGGFRPAANILNALKPKTTVSDDDATGNGYIRAQPKSGFSLETPQSVPQASVESNKLKQMLAGLKSQAN
jgi:hypothetical protein